MGDFSYVYKLPGGLSMHIVVTTEMIAESQRRRHQLHPGHTLCGRQVASSRRQAASPLRAVPRHPESAGISLMKLTCRDHPTADHHTIVTQESPSSLTAITVFCATCGALLFGCVSPIIASTAVTHHGRLTP